MTDRASLADLPDEIRELIEPHVELPPEKLDAISVAIASKRDEAKKAREASGIEAIWMDCEEAYIGIDDANRGEFADKKWAKPMSSDGPLTTNKVNKVNKNTEQKSTVFLRLTARYVDAGAAKLTEILLPADDKAFSLTETPLPELQKAKEDTTQVVHDQLQVPLTRPAKPGEIPPQPPSATAGPIPVAGPPGSPVGTAPAAAPAGAVQAGADGAPRVPLTVKDLAEENISMARKKAKLAETRIYDWMVECRYTAELRKTIFDASRLGSGVVKGPFPKPSRGIAVNKASDGGVNVQIRDKVQPSAKWLDPWNLFPDPSCGENIHDGDYCLERDYLSFRQTRKLKKIQGYIGAQIDKVLEEGPQASIDNKDSGKSKLDLDQIKKGRFEVWYYYGVLKREELDCIYQHSGSKLSKDEVPEEQKQIYCIVTMINSTVVRATINPLDSGEFPYHVMPWQRRPNSCWGIGPGEQLRMPQRTLNAATRAMLNNAGKSAGSQIVADLGAIIPADGNWAITPDKIWWKKADSIGQSVKDAFTTYDIPNCTEQMLLIIEFALKQAEEATSLPLVTQGQSGATTPDTFGATQLQNNNANQLLRSIAYSFDDHITEPIVCQFYEWLLLDPNVPEEEKGDFQINAHGSAALVERAIQDMTVAQLLPLSLNPAYKIDPAKAAKMFIKSKRLAPDDLQYTQEQQDQMDKQPPPKAPVVQAAEVRAAVDREKLVAGQTEGERDIAHEQQLHESAQALAGQELEVTKKAAERADALRLHELETKLKIATLDYANRRNISLDQAKKELAKTAMTLQAQRELNAADNAVDLHKHHNAGAAGNENGGKSQPKHKPSKPTSVAKPLAQAPGRASNGKAFEQA